MVWLVSRAGLGTGLEAVGGEKILKFCTAHPRPKSPRNRFKPGNEQGRSKSCHGLSGGPLSALGPGRMNLLGGCWMGFADHSRLGRFYLGLLVVPLLVVLAGVGESPSDRPLQRTNDRIWAPGAPVAIAVREGRATFRAPATCTGAETLVIVSALSRSPGPFPIRVEATTAPDPLPPERAAEPARFRPHTRSYRQQPIKSPPPALPPSHRDFHLMVRDGDVTASSNYLSVAGVLSAVGKRIQIYVAPEDLGQVDKELLRDLIVTFDDRIFPAAARSTGLATDVDGDGRFTILLSSWLNRLGNGRNAVDGFVRVTDLDPAFSAPFGNHCDMMYLSTRLKPGPYLRTVVAHEYMHAVVFSRKSRAARGGPVVLEEEGWLDEALAHLAEDMHGFSRANIDYRVSAFLSQPERYQLVVEDYYAADLFRSHGNRGSTYLFLRWCVDQYGPGLISALIESPLRGTANLEEATGCSFADLFRRWTVALYQGGLDQTPDSSKWGEFRSLDTRRPLERWELAGPHTVRMLAGGPAECWSAAGTTCHYVVVQAPSPGAVEIKVSGPVDAAIQVTAIPLPAGMARLQLHARSWTGADGELRLRAEIREETGQPVRLTALAWEPLVPSADPLKPGFRRGQLDSFGIAANFGTSMVSGGGPLHSPSIRLSNVHPEAGPLILKLIGTDSKGKRVAAWAQINPGPEEPSVQSQSPLAGHL